MTARALQWLSDGSVTVRGDIVMVDTETSGLYADDGARVSTVSLAFEADPKQVELLRGLGFKVEEESYVPANKDELGRTWDPVEQAWCASIALPFDQGREGKPEGRGQATLWDDAPNLDWHHWQLLLGWLLSKKLVFHNAKFDLDKMLVGVRKERWANKSGAGMNFEDQFLWDTQLAAKKIWPLQPTGLKPTCERYWGQEATLEAGAVKKYLRGAKQPAGRYDLIPWDILGPYADQDARLTWKLYWWQQQWLTSSTEPFRNLKQVDRMCAEREALCAEIDREFETMKTLFHMEQRGIPYDSARSLEVSSELQKRAVKAADALPFYPPTIAAAKSFFFGDEADWRRVAKRQYAGLELTPYATTPTGAPQMTSEVVDRMVLDEVEYIDIWARLQKVNTADGMWYLGYAEAIGADGRLRTCFRQNGTQSTRFSVERVNLQAIPHDYRLEGFDALEGLPTPRALIASAVAKYMPGWVLWELDLAQAELRVAAMWARCEKMLDAIRTGRDLHGETAMELFSSKPGDPDWGHYRQIGKRGNFTLCFGAGPKTFRGMVAKETGRVLELGEASDIVEDWNGLYPEYRRAIHRHSYRVEERMRKHGYGWVELANGTRRYFTPNEDTHKAFNQRVQGSLAQYAVDWMNRTEQFINNTTIQTLADRQGIGGVGLLLVIHDSQVLLLPNNELGEDIALNCKRNGEDLWKEWFPGVPGAIDMKQWKGDAA